MKLKERAEATAKAVLDATRAPSAGDRLKTATRIVHEALIQTVLETRGRGADRTINCSLTDEDMAHMIAVETRAAREVLIANLSSLR